MRQAAALTFALPARAVVLREGEGTGRESLSLLLPFSRAVAQAEKKGL